MGRGGRNSPSGSSFPATPSKSTDKIVVSYRGYFLAEVPSVSKAVAVASTTTALGIETGSIYHCGDDGAAG